MKSTLNFAFRLHFTKCDTQHRLQRTGTAYMNGMHTDIKMK